MPQMLSKLDNIFYRNMLLYKVHFQGFDKLLLCKVNACSAEIFERYNIQPKLKA